MIYLGEIRNRVLLIASYVKVCRIYVISLMAWVFWTLLTLRSAISLVYLVMEIYSSRTTARKGGIK